MQFDGNFVPLGHIKWGWDANRGLPTVGLKCNCEASCPWVRVFYLSQVVKLEESITMDAFLEEYKDDPKLEICLWQTVLASAANFDGGIEEALVRLMEFYSTALNISVMPIPSWPTAAKDTPYLQ